MPVYRDGNRIAVGVDQGIAPVPGLPVATTRGKATVRYGTRNDGSSRATVEAYLTQVSGVLLDHIQEFRHGRAVTVSYAGNVRSGDAERLIRAIQLVNAALPESYKLGIDRAPTEMVVALNRGANIVVNFSNEDFGNAWGRTTNINFRGSPQSIIAISSAYDSGGDRQATILLAHELMHAMGLGDHVSAVHNSILRADRSVYATAQGVPQPLSLLYPEDREALQVMYDVSKFGDWATTSTHIVGTGGHAVWGVAYRNGYAEPWAYGNLPEGSLSSSVSGSATWNGTLVGMTPSEEAVTGDATININVGTMTGRADFTELERWAAGRSPGSAGTGSMWGDGDLGYALSVRGNSFRETGGDAGRVTGVFTGLQHQGTAGTLERTDLTAAFGASRQ